MIDYQYGVKLGPLNEDNLWLYFDSRNDHKIWNWCRQFDLLTPGKHVAWFQKANEDDRIRMYEVLDPAGNFAGMTGLTDIDYVNRRAEFSLYIIPTKQRRGYARAALQTLFTHGFLNIGLNGIWGETYEGNPAFELFKDIGMLYEGTRNEFYYRNGEFIDCHLLSMSRRDFDFIEKDWIKKPLTRVK